MKVKTFIVFCIVVLISFFLACGSDLSLTSNDDSNAGKSRAAYSAVDFSKGTISDNPGNIDWYYHVPAGIESSSARPMVVALHGCTQTAADYKDRSGWNDLANKYKFFVIYPQQNSKNNSYSCFNWGGDPNTTLSNMDPAGVLRKGLPYEWKENGSYASNPGDESGSIMNMVDKMKASYNVGKVYITGLSAGGYMANLLLAVYPDVFSAGAIMAGGPYLCNATQTNPVALDSNKAYGCMRGETSYDQAGWANLVINYSNYAKPADVPWPRVQVWQGTSDYTVYQKNRDDLVLQWTGVHGISSSPTETTTLKGFAYKLYKKNGQSIVETITIDSMGHAITVDPGTGVDQCGTTGAYSEDKNICSTYYAAKFFSLLETNEAPTVTITSPVDLAYVTSPFTIAATASDDRAVTKVEFSVNGTLICTDSTAPYTCEITGYAAGETLTLKATAYDAESLTATDEITVNPNASVNITSPANNSEVNKTMTVKASGFAIDTVKFYVNNQLKCTDSSAPYECVVDLSSYNGGDTLNLKAEGLANGAAIKTDDDTSVKVQNFVCKAITATNIQHVDAGRAEKYLLYTINYVKTIGSGEDLGQLGSTYYSASTTVSETTPGYFEKGSKCGSNDGDCISSTNSEHISKGRANKCGFWNMYACAKGSGVNIGFASYGSSSIIETSSGYWEKCQ